MSRMKPVVLVLILCALITVATSIRAYWVQDGVAVCTATGYPAYQEYPTITSDGAGGAVITWQDYRSGDYDIYVQCVDAAGNIKWTTDGIAVCTATGYQENPDISIKFI